MIIESYFPVGNSTQASFSTCRASGENGPTQQLCDVSYKHEDMVVTVLEGDMAGVQVWVIPESGPYR